MNIHFKKHLTTISFLFLFGMLIAACFYPTAILLFKVILLASFLILSFSVFEKYRGACIQNKSTRIIFARNISVDIISILVTLILAVWISYGLVEFATHFIRGKLANLIIGVIIGLVIGATLGMLIKRAANHLTSPLHNN